MNSKEEKKNILKPQAIYYKEDFYNEIINGFNLQKERQQADQQKMPIILNSVQRRRFRAVIPIAFQNLFRGNMLNETFRQEYNTAKEKKIKQIRDQFVTSWYDLDYWFKQVHNEEERIQLEDKGGFIGRFIRGIKAFYNFSRLFQAIKKVKHNQGSKKLFSRSYNLTNAIDYMQFQKNLNWTLQGIQQMFSDAVVQWLLPTIRQLRAQYLVAMQKIWDRFCWWLIRTVFIGNNIVDIMFNMTMAALSVVATVFTYGAGAAAVGAGWVMKALKLMRTVTKPLKAAVKIAKAGKKASQAARVVRAVRVARAGAYLKYNRTMAVLRKAKTTMQGKKALWVARGARIKAFKKSKGVQAIRWGKRVKCVIEIGVWGWALADGAYIQVVKNEIVHRCKLLYEQVDAKWVLKARIMGETVKDLSGIVSASAKKIKKGMMQMPQRIRKDYIGMRTIQNYGKLVQVDKNQIHDNPLVLGFTKLTLAFSSVTDTIQDYWANKSRRLFKWDIAYHYKAHNRQIFSMGVGKVGFAIFTDGTKFSAEYLTTAKDYTLEGYNRKLVYKNIEHMYFYNLGKQKVIESYYILGLYQHLKAIMKVNQTSDGKSFDVSKTGKVKDQVKKAKAGDVVLTEITPHTQNHGVYDTVSVLFGRINKSEDGIQPIKGSPFSGAVNVVKDITTKWKYHTIKTDYGQASAFDITWQQSSNLRKNKAQYITTLEGIREQELKNARNLKIVVINFLDKLFPPSAQEKAAREALMDGLKKTATEFGVKLTEEAEKNVRNVLATMTLDQLKNHIKTLGEMKAQRAKDKSTLDGYNARIKGHENKIKVYQAEKAAAQALCAAAMFWSFGTAAGLGVAATLTFDYLISEEKDKLALVKQDKQTLLTNMQSSLNKFNDMCTTTLTSFGSRDVIGDFNSRKQKIR